ncbi:MAG: type III toxin-antitoxin system ToxN/AbiQ family toxin, partial [Firmicutes bacterium]|nr:type III toxin-antitoxin system ToxN/AbiQ family toxin [Bacillota bacterium]
MEFYVIKEEYINYLKEYEILNRGITKVPDVKYETQTKFALGIILEVEKIPYYVMISSFCKKQEANILIRIKGDKKEVKGSLRFNYMIPVPSHCVTRLDFETIENKKYKNLIEKEYRFCKKNKEMIMEKAVRIYDLVVNMKKKNLIDNSC